MFDDQKCCVRFREGFIARKRGLGMKKMAAGSFKTHCLAILDEVQAKRETVVITKHGKPAAKLVPVATLPQRKPKISIALGLV
jgi:prevent-host-death family protein